MACNGGLTERMGELKDAIENETPDDDGGADVEGNIANERPLHDGEVTGKEHSSGHYGRSEDSRSIECRED